MKRILDRTSCRSYLDKPIEKEKINQLKDVINSSPTAMNRQDFSCIFVTDQGKIKKLCEYAGGQKHIVEAPLFLVFYADQNRQGSASVWSHPDAIIACTMAMDAASLLGLSSCMIGHFIQHEQEVNELLNVKGDVRLALGLVVGYAKTNTPPRAKTNRCYDETYNIDLVQHDK